MQEFYIISENSKLYTFVKDNGKIKQYFVNGNTSIRYTNKTLVEKADELVEYLMEKFKAESVSDILFYIMEDVNETLTENLINAFKLKAPVEKISIRKVVENAINRLRKDPALIIDEYGLNFCGYCYMNKDGLTRKSFSLTAYTLQLSEALAFLPQKKEK